MSRDLLLVTVESLRDDYRGACPVFDDLQPAEAVTPGHYTRPSLAATLSGQYRAALGTLVRSPTLAEVLHQAGYSTIGVSHSPQTTESFGFNQGFERFECPEPASKMAGRGSWLRERLGEFRLVRAAHERLQPKHATLERLPTDEETISLAKRLWAAATPPRFCWVHLMGSHRPYGWGEDALPQEVGARAARASPARWAPTLDDEARETVVEHYRASLERVSDHVRELLAAVDDAAVVVAGDHGEEFGEDGYYFHGGYRRRVADRLTRVPLGTRNLDLKTERLGLIDLAPTLAAVAGVDAPASWDGAHAAEAVSWLTLAPWAGRVTVRYTAPSGSWTLHDADLGDIETATVDEETQAQLSALGYR